MYAQLTYFDGPRTPQQTAASDFAGRERITPAVSKLGDESGELLQSDPAVGYRLAVPRD